MKRTINKRIIIGLLAMAFILSGTGLAQAIKLRPVPGPGGDFKVEVNSAKAMFRVGEPIRFSIIGNKDFFLYVFGIDEQRGQGHLLLPSSLEPGNHFSGGRIHTVPGKQVEFFGDKPGVEKIIFVASTKKIDLDTGHYTKSGDFLTATAGVVEEQVRGIRVRPVDNAQQSAAEIKVTIR